MQLTSQNKSWRPVRAKPLYRDEHWPEAALWLEQSLQCPKESKLMAYTGKFSCRLELHQGKTPPSVTESHSITLVPSNGDNYCQQIGHPSLQTSQALTMVAAKHQPGLNRTKGKTQKSHKPRFLKHNINHNINTGLTPLLAPVHWSQTTPGGRICSHSGPSWACSKYSAL